MNHHSSYSAPRSSRTSGSGMPGGRRNKSAKRNTYNTQSWKDNPILRNLVFFVLPFAVINIILFVLITASPKIELTLGETTDYKTVGVSFKVKSILPVKDVTVTLESQPLETERSSAPIHPGTTVTNLHGCAGKSIYTSFIDSPNFGHIGIVSYTRSKGKAPRDRGRPLLR